MFRKLPFPKLDSVAWVMPQWPGDSRQEFPDYYWYATIEGLVGAINAQTGEVITWQKAPEIIENSFASGEEGIFMMTDYAEVSIPRVATVICIEKYLFLFMWKQ